MIAVKIRFFAYFRELFSASEIMVELPDGAAIGDLLDKVCDTPEKKDEIFSGGRLRSHVVVMVNGRPSGVREGLGDRLHAGDTIALFPFIGGG